MNGETSYEQGGYDDMTKDEEGLMAGSRLYSLTITGLAI